MNGLEEMQASFSESFMTTLYNKVNDLFGAGNQLFAMEFPARPLNIRTYEYPNDDSYSVLTKPYPVQEAEFLLSDQLFDISPIVQGSNGERLAVVYDTLLNNLVPRLEGLRTFVNDQKNLRNWLLTEVEDEINGERRKLSRIAMAKELYGEFLKKRNEWYAEKNKYYDECKAKNDLDEYARWLSSEGLVREDEINNFYNDTIVRGNYHEVLTLLGFLNVSSPSEVLESTKQKMRGSLRRSLDGSTDVYPVQFQPSNWFRTLRPNMSPKDLTMATDSLIAEYRGKQARLRNLQAQLSELTIVEISPEKRKALEDEIEEKERALSEAEQNLVTQYGSGALSAVKAVVNVYKELANPLAAASQVMQKVKAGKEGSLSPEEDRISLMIKDIAENTIQSITDTMKSQAEVNRQLQKLTDVRMAFTEAKVKDMRLQRLRIEEQIANVQADLDFLSPLVSGSLAAASGIPGTENADANKPETEPDLMTGTEEGVEDSGFTDIIIKSEDIASSSSGSSSSSASQSSWKVGGWFWSAGGQSSSASASSAEENVDFMKKVEIGLRVKKITFDRGGWFNPNVFKLSNNYYRLAEIRFSKGITKDDVKRCMEEKNPSAALKKLVTYTSDEDIQKSELNYTLPAFPTGFVIAKDITIKIAANETEAESSRKYMESSHSSSGGILGFRTSTSGSSKSQSEAAYFGSTADYFYIRIPGPQIIGWFLEFTPMDNTNPYQQLDPGMYAGEINSLLKEVSADDVGQENAGGKI
ncbi:MAG: hypothetical protein LBB83_03205 [Treponema sp.]|jgi:hypothetical protein|nr:hypothetical protein [Treponema sp.]